MTLREKFGMVVASQRKKCNFSQERFAIEAGIDRRYMSDIENGRRNISLDIIERICDKLNLSISELFVSVEKLEEK